MDIKKFVATAPNPEIMALFPIDFIRDVNEWYTRLEEKSFLLGEREKWFMSNIYNMLEDMKRAIRLSARSDYEKQEMTRFVEVLHTAFENKVYILEDARNLDYNQGLAFIQSKLAIGERKLMGDWH